MKKSLCTFVAILALLTSTLFAQQARSAVMCLFFIPHNALLVGPPGLLLFAIGGGFRGTDAINKEPAIRQYLLMAGVFLLALDNEKKAVGYEISTAQLGLDTTGLGELRFDPHDSEGKIAEVLEKQGVAADRAADIAAKANSRAIEQFLNAQADAVPEN